MVAQALCLISNIVLYYSQSSIRVSLSCIFNSKAPSTARHWHSQAGPFCLASSWLEERQSIPEGWRQPRARGGGGRRILAHAPRGSRGRCEVAYEAERPPGAATSPCSLPGSVSAGCGSSRAPWPGTEPPQPPCLGPASALLRGNARYRAGSAAGRAGFGRRRAGLTGTRRRVLWLLRLRPPNLPPLSSQPRSCRKMMWLPACPPALALRPRLGLGLFVLLCLGIGKREPGWGCGKGLGASSSTWPAGDGGPQDTPGAFCQGRAQGLG